MIYLNKKAKVIIAIVLFVLIAAAGYAVEYFEDDAFIMETAATDDGALYIEESGDKETDGKININSADKVELVKLSGIGETLAQRIIDYRTKNGPYGTIEEIMNVSGIREKKFEAIKDYICAE